MHLESEFSMVNSVSQTRIIDLNTPLLTGDMSPLQYSYTQCIRGGIPSPMESDCCFALTHVCAYGFRTTPRAIELVTRCSTHISRLKPHHVTRSDKAGYVSHSGSTPNRRGDSISILRALLTTAQSYVPHSRILLAAAGGYQHISSKERYRKISSVGL